MIIKGQRDKLGKSKVTGTQTTASIQLLALIVTVVPVTRQNYIAFSVSCTFTLCVQMAIYSGYG